MNCELYKAILSRNYHHFSSVSDTRVLSALLSTISSVPFCPKWYLTAAVAAAWSSCSILKTAVRTSDPTLALSQCLLVTNEFLPSFYSPWQSYVSTHYSDSHPMFTPTKWQGWVVCAVSSAKQVSAFLLTPLLRPVQLMPLAGRVLTVTEEDSGLLIPVIIVTIVFRILDPKSSWSGVTLVRVWEIRKRHGTYSQSHE